VVLGPLSSHFETRGGALAAATGKTRGSAGVAGENELLGGRPHLAKEERFRVPRRD
jgi:hypothetical protein